MKLNIKLLKKYKYPASISLTFIAVLFIFQNGSCGRNTNTGASSVSTSDVSATLASPTPIAGGTLIENTTPTPIPTATPDSNVYNLPDAPSYTSVTNGIGGKNPTWFSPSRHTPKGKTYRVKVVPLAGPSLSSPGYSDWNFPYGCITLQVTANRITKTTAILKVPGISQPAGSVCADAPTFQVLDFSVIPPAGVNFIPTVTEISNATYDNCHDTNPLIFGCAMSPVLPTHAVAASITIQGDGTWMDTPPCPNSISCPGPTSACSEGPPTTDVNGCSTACGTIACQPTCAPATCPAPPTGCSYGTPPMGFNGCASGCGSLICKPQKCEPISCPKVQAGCVQGDAPRAENGCQTQCAPVVCNSPAPTVTPSSTPVATPTATPHEEPVRPTPTSTPVPTPTVTPTEPPIPTPTEAPVPTPTATPHEEPVRPSPTATPVVTPTATPHEDPVRPTPTSTPVATPTATPHHDEPARPSPTSTPTPTATPVRK